MKRWETMWSPIRIWFVGRQDSGTQITVPQGYGYSASVELSEGAALR